MSPRKRAPRGALRPTHRARGALRPSRALPWVGLAAVAALALFWVGHRAPPPPGARELAPPLPDSIRALSPEEAYRRASLLARTDPDAALPCCRRALDDPSLELLVRLAYAAAYQNKVALNVVHRGVPGPALRSSPERIALLREALRQLDRAAALAETSEQAALVHATYARLFLMWGMPWDALAEFRNASRIQPAGWKPVADEAQSWLKDPTRSSPEPTPSPTGGEAGTEVPASPEGLPPSAGR